ALELLDSITGLPENLRMPDPTQTSARPATAGAALKTNAFAEVTGYHWLVFIIAAAGWLFDCMGQRIFALARTPAMHELLGPSASDSIVKYWAGWATTAMIIGWAT